MYKYLILIQQLKPTDRGSNDKFVRAFYMDVETRDASLFQQNPLETNNLQTIYKYI